MTQRLTRLTVILAAVTFSGSVSAQQPAPDTSAQPAAADSARSPWLLVPVFSSSPKLGTAFGGLGAYMHRLRSTYDLRLIGRRSHEIEGPIRRPALTIADSHRLDDLEHGALSPCSF